MQSLSHVRPRCDKSPVTQKVHLSQPAHFCWNQVDENIFLTVVLYFFVISKKSSTPTLAGGLCVDHQPLNRFLGQLYCWIDCLFIIKLNFNALNFNWNQNSGRIIPCLEKTFDLEDQSLFFANYTKSFVLLPIRLKTGNNLFPINEFENIFIFETLY